MYAIVTHACGTVQRACVLAVNCDSIIEVYRTCTQLKDEHDQDRGLGHTRTVGHNVNLEMNAIRTDRTEV